MNSLDQNKEHEKVVLPEDNTQVSDLQQNVEQPVESADEIQEVVAEQPIAEEVIVEEKVEVVEAESDSQQAVEQPVNEVPTEVVIEQSAVSSVNTPKTESDYTTYSKEELTNALNDLIENKDVNEIKDSVEQIKQAFYKKLKAETEEQKRKFVEDGGEEHDFKPEKDGLEDALKNSLNEYRRKKAAHAEMIEKEKENNLLQKQHILEQMKVLTETTDDVSSHINEFKDLQQKWKEIGSVSAAMSTELWKQYNLYQEKFWDLVKINNELREYAFRKNLEVKVQLCEAAEKLAEEEDVVVASRALQKLHDDWREIGPVAREVREEIWTRFKEATSTINKKHQIFFEGLREEEDKNLVLKTELCEKIEAMDVSGLKTYNAWDKATETVMAYQEEWRKIGYAPRKVNQKIFDRYRKACDAFFAAKTAFYKEVKAEMAENLEKKKALCEEAEAMKDSTDWKETTDKFIKIQKQWKEIGPVTKKHSDEIWKRFIAACDYFFEQKGKNVSDQRSEETENLEKKQALIVKIEELKPGENQKEAHDALKGFMEEWRNIGHVPYKEKDKIYKAYKAAIDKQFDALNVDIKNRRLDSFRNNLEDMTNKGEQKLYREREKLMRVFESMKGEIATYENNIGFFSSTSKKADNMLKEMERKIEALKEESKLVEQKIQMIEDTLSK